ncbi:ATP-binding protein [Paucibacter sp. M5-1]|uniref:ATP-binding protein n=1 Tax=Paucibacter sp. M5-1 TaxID=3015998 RepID=UPI0022B8F24F|nr:hypothetical protein [Paucibacter sp. M5-1]MCZ7881713.1 hypothetical protein [Paucibacter sp. M5-1]
MSEIRALLLTDVVDSTHLSTLLGDHDMAQLWAAHDRAARDLLPLHGGREIDKTDGMLLLFEQAGQALAYARAYHAALAGLHIPLKARAGLHVGPVILRENAHDDVARGAKPLEVEGLAKPTAARVMALAQGGQTLLSAEARQALGEIAAGRVQSHGHWLMKGVAEPLELFEVAVADGVPFAAPPDGDKSYRVARVGERWLPIRQIPNNLPEQLNSFIGRERELGEIKQRLQQTRLLTLLGMGGLGKTRLSLQVADELRAEFPDGVWFLDLAPLRDGALVLAEAAQVLGVREEPGRPLLQTLSAHLKTRRALLVMDNCEHLLPACASLAHALLKTAPDVRLLASSREALHVPGEQAYPVQPLPLPGRAAGIAELAASTAVRLFVARAQAHKFGFELTPDQAPAIAELVTRLEGIPLALELAAARVRLLSVADINKRLGDRYKLLTGGDRVLQQRQQTLRALVDWSHELLGEPEQQLFRRLGVFAGGFDLAAAEQVCAQAPLDSLDVLDLLGSLVEKSLVLMDTAPDGARYRLLETLREYAREKLAQAGEEALLGAAHCQHFFGVAKQIRNGMQGPEQGRWAECGDVELDNLRAAFQFAMQATDETVFVAAKMVIALQNFWILRGHVSEGREQVRALLGVPRVQADDFFHAHALYVSACLAYSQSDHDQALSLLATSLQLRRGLDNDIDTAATLSTMAVSFLNAGDAVQASIAGQEALALLSQTGHRIGESIALLQLGQIEAFRGEKTQARLRLQAALALAREIEHPEVEAEAELALGQLALEAGELAVARQAIDASRACCEAAGDHRGLANALLWLGLVNLHAGDEPVQARDHLGRALQALDRLEMRAQLLVCLEAHAQLALAGGSPDRAVRLAAGVSGLRELAGVARSPRGEVRWQDFLQRLREALPEDAYASAWQQAWGADTPQVLRLAQDA